MKRIITIVGVFLLFSCGSQDVTKKVITKSSGKNFNQIFLQIDSFGISSNIVKTPINISVLNDKLIVCDYETDSVDIFDNHGHLLFALTNTEGTAKKLINPICTYCNGDSVFVASNHGRRILTYAIENNASGKLIHSFIISQSNITPIDMTGFGNNLIMAGFNMQTEKLLHMYTKNGEFVKSFMGVGKNNNNAYTRSALNYPFVDFMDGDIYAIEHSIYRIFKFDKKGNELIKRDIRPDYYVIPDPDSINPKRKNHLKISNHYSWPIQLKGYGGHIFIQMEMPGPVVFNTPQDYFTRSHFKMDIFDTNCNPQYTGIDCGNKRLETVDKKNGIFYFVAGYSKQKKSYIIKSYSLKK